MKDTQFAAVKLPKKYKYTSFDGGTGMQFPVSECNFRTGKVILTRKSDFPSQNGSGKSDKVHTKSSKYRG